MLIDFCNEGLVHSIWCSVSESDGYSVKNLISSNKMEKQKGFLAERFIKPPVSVYIKFIEEISIGHVVIMTSVGTQTSSCVELLTGHSANVPNLLCKAFLKKETGFLFHHINDRSLKSHKNLLKQPFRTSRYSNARYLKVNILKTKDSTIPALKKVEVWGNLSNKCSEITKNKILNVWSKIVNPPSDPVIDNKSKETHIESELIVSTQSNNDELIPEEFLDPITFELIKIPMILPCGKIIDLKTLERYTSEQEKCGRSANDPFTGKCFTEISKPVFSSSLKLRIDEFLSKNSDVDIIKHASRTVGLPSESVKICRLVSKECDEKKNANCYFSIASRSSDDSTRIHDSNVQISRIHYDTFSNTPRSNNSSDEFKPNLKLNINSFDSMKSDSLNACLRQFSSKRTNRIGNSDTNFEKNSCSVCKTEENLYSIPCKHYMCRSCITVELGKEERKCLKCSTPYKSSDVVKNHSSNISSSYRII